MKHCFYGTLRKGGRWFNVFKMGLTYIKTVAINGFEMRDYTDGRYPIAYRKDGKSIVVDVVETTQGASYQIDLMEKGAGYRKEIVEVDDEECVIYIQDESKIKNWPVIKGGDYIKHIAK